MDFRVLGPLEVWANGGRVEPLGNRHQRVLAALLLAPNSVVPVSRLVAAVWDGEPPATATKQIQNCVSTLRDRLADRGASIIVTDGPGYRIVIGDDQLDVLRFQRTFAAAERLAADGAFRDAVDMAHCALRLWRGPVLDGLSAVALTGPINRLDEQRTHAIELCADWQLRLGDCRAVIEELGEQVVAHPLRERMHAQLMMALDGCGRQADALTVFTELRARLAEELGIDPGVELRELHLRILAGTRGGRTPAGAAHQPAKLSPVALEEAMRHLAAAVRRQWTAEAELRSLHRPEPVPLVWSSTRRPVSTAAAVRGEAGGARCPDFSGDLSDVVAKFRQVPSRQLVVLGEPGAGKSVLAMLLTLGLLADRKDGDPVPVLFPLSSWNPRREHLDQWLISKLLEEYPGLANKDSYGPDTAARLVLEGKILPVLDGLDETPPALHGAAIDALDQATAGGRPLVVTCRGTEYEHAVTTTGCVLTRAAVVEIQPATVEAAIAFLTARTRVGETRWKPVVEHLRRHPDSALAQALSTPLMADLARIAYAHPDTRPEELCDTNRYADPKTIEEHLLDAYLPAVYAHRPNPPAPHTRPATRRTYDPHHAQRWLRFLARGLHRQQTRDLAWWHLHRIERGRIALLLGLPPAFLFALTGWLAAGPIVGLVYGLSFATAGVMAHRTGHRPGPLRVEPRFRQTAARFISRFPVGAAIGTALGLAWSLSIAISCLLAVIFGFGIALHVWLDTPVEIDHVSSPVTVLGNDRTASAAFSLSFMMCLGPFYGMAFAATKEIQFCTILSGHFGLVLAAAAGFTSGLLGHFLLRAPGAIAYGLAGTVVGGVSFTRATSDEQAITAGVTFALAVGLTVCLARAWGAFTIIRFCLAARGRLPFRLMRFLDDAHRRGILRQAGAVYQFRHARLQDHLASPVPRLSGRDGG